MSTKLFYNAYEVQVLREVRRASKNKTNTDLNKLKQDLGKRNIQVNFALKNGKLDFISFKKNEFEINSIKGNDRVFTDRVVKSINENKNSLEQAKKEKKKPEYNRFAEMKKHREERTELLSRNMYDTKGFTR